MRYQAVLFDLWGTLVPPFRKEEHTKTISACAERLGIGFPELHQQWVETGPRRFRGEFAMVADIFEGILRQGGGHATRSELDDAQDVYLQFTRDSLQPVAGALAALDRLRRHGVRLGVVSNCAPDVPRCGTGQTWQGILKHGPSVARWVSPNRMSRFIITPSKPSELHRAPRCTSAMAVTRN